MTTIDDELLFLIEAAIALSNNVREDAARDCILSDKTLKSQFEFVNMHELFKHKLHEALAEDQGKQ